MWDHANDAVASGLDTGFGVFEQSQGGYPLTSLRGSLEAALTPSMAHKEMQERDSTKTMFKVNEKRLKFAAGELETARIPYPLCAFTDNKPIRSSTAKSKRWERWEGRQEERKTAAGSGGKGSGK